MAGQNTKKNSDRSLVSSSTDTPSEDGKRRFSLVNYPKGVFFCLGNEFAERFSFYGMNAILTLYIINVHKTEESNAKLFFHAFHFLAYFTPILGSICADGFLGRFRVILYVSIAYVFGHVLLTIGSIPNIGGGDALKALDYVGLITIAVATGGIKPCVSAFAADQFPPTMVSERKQFFSFFYFSINLGALLSNILTPIFRKNVHCGGQDSCYPLAFGVPALFMALALIIFVCGKPFYKIVNYKENVIWNVCKCIGHALVNCCDAKNDPKKKVDHWLDRSVPKYGTALVEDVKGILSIMLLYVPVIFFWALFDQQGSTWVLQGNRMDGRLGRLTILPDQFALLNPLFIITMIPFFEGILYPFLAKYNILTSSLRRMGWGGVLAALSFFIAGFIQLKINKTMVVLPSSGYVSYVLANHGECEVQFNGVNVALVSGSTVSHDFTAPVNNRTLPEFTYLNCSKQANQLKDVEAKFDSSKGQFVVFWDSLSKPTSQVAFDLEKTENSNSRLYPLLHPSYLDLKGNVSLVAFREGEEVAQFAVDSDKKFFDLEPPLLGLNVFDLFVESCTNMTDCSKQHLKTFEAKPGEANGLILLSDKDAAIVNLIKPNTVHILWQVPQFFIITVAEMLFSISGLEFSYSQASPAMKSVLQAIWLMTISFGNVLDMIISGSKMISDPAVEFFVYATLMLVVMAFFVLLAHRYKYVDKDKEQLELQQ